MKPALLELQKLLKREVSAKEIAREMKCDMSTAYRRLEALTDAGATFVESTQPNGKTGPVPVKYRLLKPAP